ncbi:DUF937 domain-containing protein [Planctomyces sp. SH-PL62]|uniref:DUF937 domain-containing protein n=1 Tax=Planctomyces sp. SH-PL62 TaxID=1636152 RepID=UPI00078C2279|nr:DUF937 domain-containing protein [Planctomyces sp. SH-PL62]AMV39273.1 hypothetical protein VT85_17680 [Planctomyces sp. SH-PL62]
MASIIDVIKDQLSGDMLGKMSSAIGESEAKTRSAAGAAVPSVLALLANEVLSGKGAGAVLETLKKYAGGDETATLRSPGAHAPGETPSAGSDVLGSLLGPNFSTLINILSKFSGVGLSAVKTLLSHLGPIILGAVAAQMKSRGGLNPSSLTSFFAAEKANITKALPAGLSLGDFPSIPGVPTSVHRREAQGSSIPGWILPALALGLIGLATWYFMSGPFKTPQTDVVPLPKPTEAAPAVVAEAEKPALPEVTLPPPTADEVSMRLNDVYGEATRYLTDVKDAAGAETALPALSGLQSQLDGVKSLWEKLPVEARKTVVEATATASAAFKSLVDKAMEIPGVGEKLKPVLDALVAKMGEFTA